MNTVLLCTFTKKEKRIDFEVPPLGGNKSFKQTTGWRVLNYLLISNLAKNGFMRERVQRRREAEETQSV
jgi:hypothetical protein